LTRAESSHRPTIGPSTPLQKLLTGSSANHDISRGSLAVDVDDQGLKNRPIWLVRTMPIALFAEPSSEAISVVFADRIEHFRP
jgi:hypothetical protein